MTYEHISPIYIFRQIKADNSMMILPDINCVKKKSSGFGIHENYMIITKNYNNQFKNFNTLQNKNHPMIFCSLIFNHNMNL